MRLMKKISKFLALILRHDPKAGNITLDGEGWADTRAVLTAIREKFGQFSAAQLVELVADDDKSRYVFSEHGMKIRANQGHSISVDLKLVAITPPGILYHGTKSKYLRSILRDGLIRGERQYVHLSADVETARKVASRRSGDDILLVVRANEMTDHSFYRSENGVWLVDAVPACHLEITPWPE